MLLLELDAQLAHSLTGLKIYDCYESCILTNFFKTVWKRTQTPCLSRTTGSVHIVISIKLSRHVCGKIFLLLVTVALFTVYCCFLVLLFYIRTEIIMQHRNSLMSSGVSSIINHHAQGFF
jgi:hypothetical protein